MPIASIRTKRVQPSRYSRALFWGNVLAYLVKLPKDMLNSIYDRFVIYLSQTPRLFDVFGQLRLVGSFITGLIATAGDQKTVTLTGHKTLLCSKHDPEFARSLNIVSAINNSQAARR